MNIFISSAALLVVLSIGLAHSAQRSYNDHKLVKIYTDTDSQRAAINDFEATGNDIDVWEKNADSTTVLLSPIAYQKYKRLFASRKMRVQMVNNNMKSVLEEQDVSMRKSLRATSIVGRYVRLAEIQNYVSQIVAENPAIASSYSAGNSYEGRSLTVLVLKTKTSSRSVWIDCGIHAREWVSPAACVKFIDNIIAEYKSIPTKSILSYFEFHIMPVLNPDGYSGGSSNMPCSEVYMGTSANSEPETQAVENALAKKYGQWDAYLTIHSYGNFWLTNWGFTSQLPDTHSDMMAKAYTGVSAIKAYNGSHFNHGSSTVLMYVASGGSEDWAHGVAKIPYCYCLELRPGSGDKYYNTGFALPEQFAKVAGDEAWAGIRAFLSSIKK